MKKINRILFFAIVFFCTIKLADAAALECVYSVGKLAENTHLSDDLKDKYNLNFAKVTVRFDCGEPTFTCESTISGIECKKGSIAMTISDFETDDPDKPYACPSKIFYKQSNEERNGEMDLVSATIGVSATSSGGYSNSASLIEEESTQNVDANTCQHTAVEPNYDNNCEYGDFIIRFNAGDSLAKIESSDPAYANIRMGVSHLTTCPDKIYELCREEDGAEKCYLYTSDGTGREEVLLHRNNGEVVEHEPEKQEGFSPNKLCKDEENCDINLNGFCGEPTVSRVLKFIGLIIFIAKILVPAIIIIMGFVTLFKIITSGKEDEAKKQVKNIIRNIVIGILIFLLPSLINFVFDIADDIISPGETSDFSNCVNCLTDPNNSSKCIIQESDND